MRLATLHVDTSNGPSTRAAIRDGDNYRLLAAVDVGGLLRAGGDLPAAASRGSGETIPVASARLAPPVRQPRKVVCVGLNYADHIAETGRESPRYPTLFAKFADTLTGAEDEIDVPAAAEMIDWEAELAVIVGRRVRSCSAEEGRQAVAGYTVANDISMRDWQRRTVEWLQGKAFEASCPIGPEMVTPDEFDPASGARIECLVNGKVMQSSTTDQLVFTTGGIISYVSSFMPLEAGDIVLTGTPGGVALGQTPPRYLQDGDVVETTIEGLGRLRNVIRIAG